MPTPRPYDRIEFRGHTLDRITVAAIVDAEHKLPAADQFNITQGSYAGGFGPSAGTHDGGGVFDAIPKDVAQARRWESALRSVGFMAYVRMPIAGLWPLHVHAGLIGNRKASAALRAQFAEYLLGGDALVGSAPDTGPRQFIDVRYTWQRGDVRVIRARRRIDAALNDLAAYSPSKGGVRGYAVGATRKALRKARAELPRVPAA